MKFSFTIATIFFHLVSHSQVKDFSAYDTAGNYEFKLIDSLQKRIKTQPKNALLYYQRSRLILGVIYEYSWSGHTIKEAMNDINKAIQLKPDTADFYVFRSKCYEYWEATVDSMKLAIKDMSKAISLSPKNAVYYKRRASLNLDINAGRSIICDDIKAAMELGDEDAKETYLKGCKN